MTGRSVTGGYATGVQRFRRGLVAVGAVLAVGVLAGCTPEQVQGVASAVDGRVKCEAVDGRLVCSYTPTAVQPPVTQPPTTVPPTTVPPTTVPPTTVPPTTEPPVTVPPTTEPPATSPPATVPPTTQPPTKVPPVASGDTAAARLGWGTPIAAASDEFNGTSLDRSKWSPYSGPGHAGNGRRVAGNNVVGNGYLRQVGAANGDSAGLASTFNQRYGKWEARVRSQGSGSGSTYHPVLIIWPQSDRWPADGEYDFLENGAPGAACAEAFIHYPHPRTPVQQEFKRETNCGAPLSEWHHVAFEWTPQFVAGYIDGVQWFKYSGGAGPNGRANIQDMPSGHLTIQLDNFHGSGMQPATFDVDWVRTYR